MNGGKTGLTPADRGALLVGSVGVLLLCLGRHAWGVASHRKPR